MLSPRYQESSNPETAGFHGQNGRKQAFIIDGLKASSALGSIALLAFIDMNSCKADKHIPELLNWRTNTSVPHRKESNQDFMKQHHMPASLNTDPSTGKDA